MLRITPRIFKHDIERWPRPFDYIESRAVSKDVASPSSVFKISKISADISSIFRVSVNVNTIYPSDNRSTEISEFFCNYRLYFADISVFYQFLGIFPDISALFIELTLFMNSDPIYRLYFADISVFYRFFGIFPDISALFIKPTLFMNSQPIGSLFIME